jgi:hypothetical protein
MSCMQVMQVYVPGTMTGHAAELRYRVDALAAVRLECAGGANQGCERRPAIGALSAGVVPGGDGWAHAVEGVGT